MLLDFDCDACQSPARAYLIDVCRAEDHSTGLSMFTVMAGAGGCIGYTLGGIPWADLFGKSHVPITKPPNPTTTTTTPLFSNQSFIPLMKRMVSDIVSNVSDVDSGDGGGDIAYEHKQILFTMVAVIYVICVAISVTSFKEIPLDMVESQQRQADRGGGGGGEVVRMRARGSMKYKRMEEENFDDEYEWESGMGDEIDAISIDRVEFKHERMETGKFEAMRS